MSLKIQIPDSVGNVLRAQLGDRLERDALERLALYWFGKGRITLPEVAQMLHLNLDAAHEFLKDHGCVAPMDIEVVEKDPR